MLIYIDRELVSVEEAKISAVDHGFLYGVGLFETIRAYNGRLFLWDRHLSRLKSGLSAFQIAQPWSDGELLQAVQQTMEANGLRDAYVRLDITAGAEGVGLHSGGYTRPRLLVFAKPVSPLADPPRSKRLVTVSFPRQTAEGTQRYKSHMFGNNVLAKLEVGDAPDVEGLFLTAQGFVCEGIVSNVFWVKHNRLYTPALTTGALAGITRSYVMELARQQQWEVCEGEYPLAELASADEVFLTNSIQEIVPVSHINQTPLPVVYGPVTKKLRQAYRRSVELLG
ncbi:MAG: aminodeoxychorismate lyase [Brevibacillus sp.]|nr:aminodeoxychorismate lyase [Brevibacillus sp.]